MQFTYFISLNAVDIFFKIDIINLSNSWFEENIKLRGPIITFTSNTESKVSIDNITFINNKTPSKEGLLRVYSYNQGFQSIIIGILSIINSRFESNIFENYAGVILVEKLNLTIFNNLTFTNSKVN
jgi:hypothetical protein